MQFKQITVYEAEDGSIYKTLAEAAAHVESVAVDYVTGLSPAVLKAAVAAPDTASAELVSAIGVINDVLQVAAAAKAAAPAAAAAVAA